MRATSAAVPSIRGEPVLAGRQPIGALQLACALVVGSAAIAGSAVIVVGVTAIAHLALTVADALLETCNCGTEDCDHLEAR